ncbi:UNVERIFIED_CONTAM: hypothetical protein Sradi_0000700 [Sesamum radiatum]|uniref:CCHC-type domain-containing protein n=1 Tax=Sesamum radiatum TaxID=300843 RepID=A0AAW2WGJ2_SESRA
MHALKLGEESTFQSRQYNPERKCARSFNVKNVNSKWLSTKYEDPFRTDPKRNVKGFRKDVIKELRCHVSRNQAYRAKKKALEAIEGKAKDQFDSLWDYASKLRNSNLGSTLMMVMTDGDDVRDDVYTFISDKQKGLIPAFEYVFPGANNRFCVRHLHGNMKTAGFRGLAFKKVLWNAAKATTMSEFNYRMEELAKLDPKVVDWLSDKPPAHWSRKWDLTGIPCNHGMSAICSQSLEPDDFVNPYYSVATFIEVYKHAILPVNGLKLWEKIGFVPPLPPNFGKGVRRPARARRMEHDEPQNKGKKRIRGQKNQTIKLKRQPYKVMCHYCGETGHNPKGCARKKMDHPVELSVAKQPRKMTARKKTSTTKQPTVIAEKAPQKSASQQMLHKFTQCSIVNQSSANGVPCLTKGGKKFVTMTNLSAAVAATKKKKKIDKEAK